MTSLLSRIEQMPVMPTLEQAFEHGREWEVSRTVEFYRVRLALALEVLRELVTSLAEQDDEGLIEHAEQMQAARALLEKVKP